MNCIDVHRKLTAEPNAATQNKNITAHLAQCNACAKFANSIQQFDQALHAAAKTDIPDGLAERILLKQNFIQQHQRRKGYKLFALVASLFLVMALSFNSNIFSSLVDDAALSLEDTAINHVASELDHLKKNKNIQLTQLNNLLQPFNIQFKNAIGNINYAGTCPIRNSRGVHIVLQEKNIITTLLVMPGEYIKARRTYSKGNFNTTLIPTQNGSIAIVTEKNNSAEQSHKLEKDLNQALYYI